jgi:hypothetical protein
MAQQMNISMVDDLRMDLYTRVRRAAPHLRLDYIGEIHRLGYQVQMLGMEKPLCIDKRIVARGSNKDYLVEEVMREIEPHIGFMTGTKYFALQVLDVGRSVDHDGYQALIVWGVK